MAATESWAPKNAARREMVRVIRELAMTTRFHTRKEERMLYSAVDRLAAGQGHKIEWELQATSPRAWPEWSWAAALFGNHN